jgi:hypothetical protein
MSTYTEHDVASDTEDDAGTDSVDNLIARQLPDWLKNASSSALQALHLALKREHESAEKIGELLKKIPGPDAFSAPLLEAALLKQYNISVDVRTALLCTVVRREFPSIFPLPPVVRTVRTFSLPLLAVAMHNFAEEELQARSPTRRRVENHAGAPLQVSFVQFAKLCRALDLGKKYQAELEEHLTPPDTEGTPAGQARLAVATMLEESTRSAMEAAVRVAAIKGQIDESSFTQMLQACASHADPPAETASLDYRQLYALGQPVQGVVTIEARDDRGGSLRNLLVWIPGDPVQSVRRYGTWEALYEALGQELRDVSYADFFTRFIAEEHRLAFTSKLKGLRKSTKAGAALELDGRNFPISEPLFAYLRAQRIKKIFDDAKVFMVPTGVEDASSRVQRLKGYENVGLTLLGLAGLFVPVLGEIMLGVTAIQIADEVYEGYQDWKVGDREAALGHVFSVAENLVVGAAVGAGLSVGAKVLKRVAFVDDLTPVLNESGRVKLRSNDLTPYRLDHEGAAATWQFHDSSQGGHLHLHDGAFQVARSQDGKRLLIRHPERKGAYGPVLERNGRGGWSHELEQPQEWSGELRLLRRLDAKFAGLTQEQATALLDCTGYDEARLRQLCAEGASAPARLQDAFEQHLAVGNQKAVTVLAPEAEEVEDAILRKSFPSLSVRCAKEVRQEVDSVDLEALRKDGKVSLALAERVRWMLRDSRLDRACAGLRQRPAVNEDTEKLALGLVNELAPWPANMRIELRKGSLQGDVQTQVGAEVAQQVVRIVKKEHGYSVHVSAQGSAIDSTTTDSLMNALSFSMGDDQKLKLGDALLSERQLVDKLATHARSHRDLASKLIGQSLIGGGLRPPVRFGDGRLGYPLSGRPESLRQACRRGLRQIFPTLDDAELQRYMLAVTRAGVDPWAHYEALHGQLQALRQTLKSWAFERMNVLTLLRRDNVATRIRRCWRRKIGRRGDGSYALEISGERVGGLPRLPRGVQFEHVTRLMLRDMELEQIDADFLARFPNLTELDLRNNQLPSIPSGVEALTRLRIMRLDNNRIVLTQADSQRLSALTRLERLDLNHNPLGSAPDVSRLLNLQHVGLRSASLTELPEASGQVPWRGLVDLRNNAIQRLNRENAGLRLRLSRMVLHDNPLDEASEHYLEEQAGPSNRAGGETALALSYRQHVARQAELSDWLTEPDGDERSYREELWSQLSRAPDGENFFRFLSDLASSRDYLKDPAYFRYRVWKIIELCVQNSEQRELIFVQAAGPGTCEDRLLWLLSQMETQTLAHTIATESSPAELELKFMQLGRSLSRVAKLEEIAAAKVNALKLKYANIPERLARVDDVEVHLRYRVALRKDLGLSGQPYYMNYAHHSLVGLEDIDAAYIAVLEAESKDALVNWVSDEPYWQNYLRLTYPADFSALEVEPSSLMEASLQRVMSNQSKEWDHWLLVEQLSKSVKDAEKALIKRLTVEAYDRCFGGASTASGSHSTQV